MSLERRSGNGSPAAPETSFEHGAGTRTPARVTHGDGRRVTRANGRSIPDLLRELSGEGADLVRQEVALAKAEMNQKLEVFQKSAVSMAVGGGLLLAALLTALWAVNAGLTALFAQFMEPEIAVWASPLVLAIVLAAIGWGLVASGRRRMSEEGVTPKKTKASLESDRQWAARKVREVKEDIQHG